MKKWMAIDEMTGTVALPERYRLALLKRGDIPELVRFIKSWFPDISVGSASCYLRDQFYAENVFLADERERDVLVILIRKDQELAGLFSCEREPDTLALYARLAVVSPKHRGARLGQTCVELAEAIGRHMGMGLIYAMATLKFPYVQMAFENLGWRLIGIAPGYDREMIAPGVVKRVYEAVYAKVLVADAGLLRPTPQDLTPTTKAFFDLLFPEQELERVQVP
jgi:GNAT superfamily N-acetyltransferase